MARLASLLNLVEKKMNNCPKCGWNLSGEVGPQGDSYLDAIERARERLKKEIGFGVPERTYKHIKEIIKELPLIKKIEREKINETKVSKSEG